MVCRGGGILESPNKAKGNQVSASSGIVRVVGGCHCFRKIGSKSRKLSHSFLCSRNSKYEKAGARDAGLLTFDAPVFPIKSNIIRNLD